MELFEAQSLAWTQQADIPKTYEEAMARLQEAMERCSAAFANQRLVHTQMELETVLVQTLVVMKRLGMDPDRGLQRALSRMSQASANKQTFCFFPDRVEILAGGEYRGGWALFTEEDWESAQRLAQELGCEVIDFNEESRQLGLFDFPKEPGADEAAESTQMRTA